MPVRLFSTANSADVESAFLPWLDSAREIERRPTLVLVPSRADASFLKVRALAGSAPLLGVRFVTPPELRTLLGREAVVPMREHLRLLLATAAEKCGTEQAAIAVASAPDHLLKTHDLLNASGWAFAEAGPATLRPIVAKFEHLVADCGFQLMPAADRALLASAPKLAPRIAQLFVSGFNGLHWPLWPLLAAAVHSASEALVCLTEPRTEAADLDQTWIGTWEETFGATEPVPPSDRPRPFVELLEIPEGKMATEHRQEHPESAIEFLIGHNTSGQARAIVAKALGFLAGSDCTRLGILFPAAGALSRLVAELLATHHITHNDALAHLAPGPLEDVAWPAWLELQESPRTAVLLRFLHALPAPSLLFGDTPLSDIESNLRRTLDELLIDDIPFLAAWFDAHPHRSLGGKLPAGLRTLPLLPEKAELGAFIAQTDAIFTRLGWSERAEQMHRFAADWKHAHDLPISRRSWLRWLGETLDSWRAQRDESGNHPYSRVHLLPYAQAESQAWSHLIVAGLNEGCWPPALDDSGWLGEEEIDALNRRIRILNERATREGRHGEGHWTVSPGHTLCLGPTQRRALVQRQFLNTLESASIAIAATAQLFDENKPDRQLNPSDFFTRLYFCARGRAVSQNTFRELHRQTAAWLDTSDWWKDPSPDYAAIQQTRLAYDARRTPGRFGEYEFSLRTPPAQPLRLWVTAWERALTHPAEVWLRHVLGVEAQPEEGDDSAWNLALGKWAHRWLSMIPGPHEDGAFAPLPDRATILARVRDAGATFCEEVIQTLRRGGRELPDWWLSLWHQALRVAGDFAQRVAEVDGYSHLATEWKLPESTVRLDETRKLHIRGRADAILAKSALSVPEAPWIIDYKTGSKKSVAPSSSAKTPQERQQSVESKLRSGDGLQLALYALALQSLCARSFGVTRLSPDLSLDEPQLTDADLSLTAQARLWSALCEMQDTAVFGMKGKVRDAYSFQRDYPLATLSIDPELLDAKWGLTHPSLTDSGEESE